MTDVELKPVIGLEVHAQLLTASKMFCGCSASYAGAEPNTHVCAVCGGMPGALPVINRGAVEKAILTALALECSITEVSRFDRKNYPYPDLPKGYQISQYERPLGTGGRLAYVEEGELRHCGIVRVHLEEDTGKLIHSTDQGREVSLVDYNRSGVPLMEIVSEPQLASPASAREFFVTLRQLLMYLGVNDGNLQEGSLRADVNVSLRAADGSLGTKVEIKNLNSFRAVERALEYEIGRQREVLQSQGTIPQETRGWSERDEVTVSQRSKEYAQDYRYFPEPDLPPIRSSAAAVREIAARLPELPAHRARRFEEQLGLPASAARVLTSERPLADFYERAVGASTAGPRAVANWVLGDVLRLIRETGAKVEDEPVSAESVGRVATLVEEGRIGTPAAKAVLETMFETHETPDAVVQRLDLGQMSDDTALERIVDQILASNDAIAADYRAGKLNAIQVLVGKVMKETRGKAPAPRVLEILRGRLGDK